MSRPDLLVAGAGPVGLAVAIDAARAGLTVLLADPRPAPVDKACGEGIMPGGLAALRRLGVDPSGHPLAGIRYCTADGSAAAEARFATGPGLGVRRTALSAALEQRAGEVGVRRVRAALPPPWPHAGGVRAGEWSARWYVAADGLHSPTRRALGWDRPTRRAPRRYGVRRHYRVAPWTDLVEVHWSRTAEAYVTPLAPDCVGVAVLGPGAGDFGRWLAAFPALRVRLGGAPALGRVAGAGPLHQRSARRVSGPVLLAGDAAGYVDALTGEGLSVGLAGARALVDCLVAGQSQAYEERWQTLSRRYRLLTTALLAVATRPAPRSLLVPAAQRLPGVFGAAVRLLE